MAVGDHQCCLPLWSTLTGRMQTSSFNVDFIKNSSTLKWSGVTAHYNGILHRSSIFIIGIQDMVISSNSQMQQNWKTL